MKKDIPCKQSPKENRSGYTNMRQNRLKIKIDYKKQRRTLYTDKMVSSSKEIMIFRMYAPTIEHQTM